MERLRPSLEEHWDPAEASFPVRVTRSFGDRVRWEDEQDPLGLQVWPDPREMEDNDTALVDPVGDQKCSPLPWVIHKYADRVLVLLTRHCHLHCRYCFRRTFDVDGLNEPTASDWEDVLSYLRKVRPYEVILSGGDPLTLSDTKLLRRLDDVRQLADVVRLHTRAPITQPSRVTPALCHALGARSGVWMVVHCNHPRELNDEVRTALEGLVAAGMPVLNQAVLLRGVNDDADVLVDLFRALTGLRVQPYYLHHPDRVRGAQHFWVEPEEGLALYRTIRPRLSGVSAPTYVIDPPDGSGKVLVSDWLRSQSALCNK
jgi:lysine 2,3-aminomutase